jgi:hypothetical protein
MEPPGQAPRLLPKDQSTSLPAWQRKLLSSKKEKKKVPDPHYAKALTYQASGTHINFILHPSQAPSSISTSTSTPGTILRPL